MTNEVTSELINRVVYTIGHDQISQTTFTPSGDPEGETLVFHADGRGSTRILTNLAAAIATYAGFRQIFHFDAFGNAIGFNPAQALTAYLYVSEQFNANTGNIYLRARDFDPKTGRLNPLDPFTGNMRDPQSLHKYLYAHADPVNGWDPTGNFSVQGMVSAIGGALSTIGQGLSATVSVLGRVGSLLLSGIRGFHSFGPILSGTTWLSTLRWWGVGVGIAYFIGRYALQGVFPQSNIQINTDGPSFSNLNSSAEFLNAITQINANNNIVTFMAIRGHGEPVGMHDDDMRYILFSQDTMFSTHTADDEVTRVDNVLRNITDANSVIELRGCFNTDLAKNLARSLDNGTKVVGFVGFSIGNPFGDEHSGFSRAYRSFGGVLEEL